MPCKPQTVFKINNCPHHTEIKKGSLNLPMELQCRCLILHLLLIYVMIGFYN